MTAANPGKVPGPVQSRDHGTTVFPIADWRGNVVAEHVRRDLPDGGKSFVWRRNGSLGLKGLAVANLPLYGSVFAARWSLDRPVLVVEGEKATRALHDSGWQVAGTVCGAASCPSRESLMVLAGHDVALWPDNDEAGIRHMHALARALGEPGEIAASLRWIVWADAPEKGDAADALAAGVDVASLVASAVPVPPVHHAMVRISDYPRPRGEWSASEALRTLYGVERAAPGRTVRCPRHEDRRPSLSILPDDQRVVCHATGCEWSSPGIGSWQLHHPGGAS